MSWYDFLHVQSAFTDVGAKSYILLLLLVGICSDCLVSPGIPGGSLGWGCLCQCILLMGSCIIAIPRNNFSAEGDACAPE